MKSTRNQQVSDANNSRRRPLLRAMSAPSQHLSNRTFGTINSKKTPIQPPPPPSRRRKAASSREDLTKLRQTFTSVQIKEDDDYSDKEENQIKNKNQEAGDAGTRKSSAKTRNRTTTTFTCDQIVTLVSLLDSTGSDSEREGETGNHKKTKEEPAQPQPQAEKPPLRKAGKSGKQINPC